jgi:hypothetical protein
MNNGHIMVSDGYCNSRVVRYDAQGQWHCQYELPPEEGGLPKAQNGKAGGEGMAVVHSIALQECDEALFVADREKMRVVQFNIKSHALEGEGWLGRQRGGGLCTVSHLCGAHDFLCCLLVEVPVAGWALAARVGGGGAK